MEFYTVVFTPCRTRLGYHLSGINQSALAEYITANNLYMKSASKYPAKESVFTYLNRWSKEGEISLPRIYKPYVHMRTFMSLLRVQHNEMFITNERFLDYVEKLGVTDKEEIDQAFREFVALEYGFIGTGYSQEEYISGKAHMDYEQFIKPVDFVSQDVYDLYSSGKRV